MGRALKKGEMSRREGSLRGTGNASNPPTTEAPERRNGYDRLIVAEVEIWTDGLVICCKARLWPEANRQTCSIRYLVIVRVSLLRYYHPRVRHSVGVNHWLTDHRPHCALWVPYIRDSVASLTVSV
jgi:hypothetical protein